MAIRIPIRGLQRANRLGQCHTFMAWLAVPNDIAPCLAADSILSRFESNSFRLTAGGEGQLILACPAGTPENSPGFQAWEGIQTRTPSPEGTAESVRLFSLHKY